MSKCGLCGKDPADGDAWVNDVAYCHDDDGPKPTCFETAQRTVALGTIQEARAEGMPDEVAEAMGQFLDAALDSDSAGSVVGISVARIPLDGGMAEMLRGLLGGGWDGPVSSPSEVVWFGPDGDPGPNIAGIDKHTRVATPLGRPCPVCGVAFNERSHGVVLPVFGPVAAACAVGLWSALG